MAGSLILYSISANRSLYILHTDPLIQPLFLLYNKCNINFTTLFFASWTRNTVTSYSSLFILIICSVNGNIWPPLWLFFFSHSCVFEDIVVVPDPVLLPVVTKRHNYMILNHNCKMIPILQPESFLLSDWCLHCCIFTCNNHAFHTASASTARLLCYRRVIEGCEWELLKLMVLL